MKNIKMEKEIHKKHIWNIQATYTVLSLKNDAAWQFRSNKDTEWKELTVDMEIKTEDEIKLVNQNEDGSESPIWAQMTLQDKESSESKLIIL